MSESLPRPQEVCIAVENTPTPDNRLLLAGAINWQFGHALPLRSAREWGMTIGFIRAERLDGLKVIATLHVEPGTLEEALRGNDIEGSSIGLGVDLDNLDALPESPERPLTVTFGRLRAVTLIDPAQVSWPECVVSLDG